MKIDYSRIAGDLRLQKAVNQISFLDYIGLSNLAVSQQNALLSLGYTIDDICLASKYVKNQSKRKNNCKKRIVKIFDLARKCGDYLYFCTFTLDDAHVDFEKSRIVLHLRRCLAMALDYVANEDYGDLNGRLHYHAVVRCDTPRLTLRWLYGYVHVEPISNCNEHSLTEYLLKIGSHATKESAGHVIYSRTRSIR